MADNQCAGCSSSQEKGQKQQKQHDDEKLNKALGRIKNKLVILSGKGGVGKSSVATNLAVGLSLAGKKVGLMDVDVHGPSIPRLLNLAGKNPQAGENCLLPIPWSENLSVISIGFMLPSKNDSVIWRGPIKMGLIRQFLEEVAWGDLDYLVVDCPPGTGDEPISVMQLLGKDAQAVVVTTPQNLSIDDVRRSINFCSHTGNPVLGVIENMSGFVCPHCKKTVDIFNSGGGEALATETNVAFLGRIPLDPEMVRSADEGQVYVHTQKDNPTGQALHEIVQGVIKRLDKPQDQSQTAQKTAQTNPAAQEEQKNGNFRIAVPVADGKLCLHFGHCEKFALVYSDKEKKSITNVEYLNPPPHEPGVLPKWLAEQNINLVIAGGMGSRAQQLFQEHSIQVLTGAQPDTPEELVQAYLNGTLQTGDNVCDH